MDLITTCDAILTMGVSSVSSAKPVRSGYRPVLCAIFGPNAIPVYLRTGPPKNRYEPAGMVHRGRFLKVVVYVGDPVRGCCVRNSDSFCGSDVKCL